MSASEIGQSAEVGYKSTVISMARALNSSRLKQLFPLSEIHAIKAASAVSFGHNPLLK
jgi:hypothetical protein